MTTFRDLLTAPINVENHKSPLDDWFYQLIDISISKFSIADICRAIRQKLFLDSVLPVAYEMLKNDPLAGEYYDGELIASIASISNIDISKNIISFREIKKLLQTMKLSELPQDLQQDILKITIC